MNNIWSAPRVTFEQRTTPAVTTVALGAAAWIDTDMSAITGVDTTKPWLIFCRTTGVQVVGARPHGSAQDTSFTPTAYGVTVSHVDNTGHMDLWRNAAANTDYMLMGAFTGV